LAIPAEPVWPRAFPKPGNLSSSLSDDPKMIHLGLPKRRKRLIHHMFLKARKGAPTNGPARPVHVI
jgi:hypothetical protein